MLFRKTLLILGMAASLSATAGAYQCKKGDVSLPCEYNAWTLGGDALYLNHNGGSIPATQSFGAQLWNLPLAWGLRVEAGRHFGNGNDFNVNWAYFNQTTALTDNANSLYRAAPSLPGPQNFNYKNYMSVVNLELGQAINFGEKWDLRAHVGMQIDNLEEKAQTTPGVPITDKVVSRMIGARIGLDSAYHLWEGVSFYANGALGGLYSNQNWAGNASGIFASGGNNAGFNGNQNDGVLEMDFNVGLKYTYQIAQGDIVGRVGWVDYNWSGTTALGDFAWQGLIFGAKWVGNA